MIIGRCEETRRSPCLLFSSDSNQCLYAAASSASTLTAVPLGGVCEGGGDGDGDAIEDRRSLLACPETSFCEAACGARDTVMYDQANSARGPAARMKTRPSNRQHSPRPEYRSSSLKLIDDFDLLLDLGLFRSRTKCVNSASIAGALAGPEERSDNAYCLVCWMTELLSSSRDVNDCRTAPDSMEWVCCQDRLLGKRG